MDKLLITGGQVLRGDVFVSGAKNAALPLLAATLLAEGETCLLNVPNLRDIDTMRRLLLSLGAESHYVSNEKRFCVQTSPTSPCLAHYDLVRTMRASIVLLGPLLARYGKAKVSLPGGCAIGARPVNLHLSALEKMGAKIDLADGYILAECDRLQGAEIWFDTVTVTGTENIMMAATLAQGKTILRNAAREPEVRDLANCLIQMGARIEGAGTDTITIEGVEALQGTTYSIMPDRIEAGTLIVAAAITGGDVHVIGDIAPLLDSVIIKLRDCGVKIESTPQGVRVIGNGIISRDVTTSPYPGFPTDMQAQYMALMCRAKGVSSIEETIFENRFMHVAELRRMGAQIEIQGPRAVVRGAAQLKGAPVMATDLRASASLVLAALAAEGTTEVQRIYHLDRGYEQLETKLAALGAQIERVSS
ncbi:UDP-N-acetylglucosamine 1-carboxyvinyltransferase [Chrysiogenes arsenatis]|uniref:UDP-N-acetylglucosamine 1-carboxyvinyltransferase n=1 Tax=Chrysiogenes arsenatis TaxID=309797 RepID=UPI000415216B|nr:UDP-N-acetylglucosamine 1-carboxyvinyltransferase [Chrysiogenes arsenatis]